MTYIMRMEEKSTIKPNEQIKNLLKKRKDIIYVKKTKKATAKTVPFAPFLLIGSAYVLIKNFFL